MSALGVASNPPTERALELTHQGLVDLSPARDGRGWRLRRLRHQRGIRDEQDMELSVDEIHALQAVLAQMKPRDQQAP